MDVNKVKAIAIAKVYHQMRKALCETYADYTQKDWEQCEQWERDIEIEYVENWKCYPDDTLAVFHHERFIANMSRKGWSYGETPNREDKKHPVLAQYSDLPCFQKIFDEIFKIIESTL